MAWLLSVLIVFAIVAALMVFSLTVDHLLDSPDWGGMLCFSILATIMTVLVKLAFFA